MSDADAHSIACLSMHSDSHQHVTSVAEILIHSYRDCCHPYKTRNWIKALYNQSISDVVDVFRFSCDCRSTFTWK
jgi:hypothetical protein